MKAIETMGSIMSEPRPATHDSPPMINFEDCCIALIQNSSSIITHVPKKEGVIFTYPSRIVSAGRLYAQT